MYLPINIRAPFDLPVLICFLLLAFIPLALNYLHLLRPSASHPLVSSLKGMYGILARLVIGNGATFFLDRFLGSGSSFPDHPIFVLFLLFLIDLPFMFLICDSLVFHHTSKQNSQVDMSEVITQRLHCHTVRELTTNPDMRRLRQQGVESSQEEHLEYRL